jgi:ATP-dependent protease ClpP protease subunit
MSETKLMPFMEPNKLFATEYHDHVRYDYYLVGNIGDPEDYLDLCHALRSCGQQDEFFLRFNSGGGQVRTGNQILNALRECPVEVVGFIEHDCGSMTTFLFLACDTWGVSKYAEWFSHTVSGGNYGKENETFESSQFLRKQTHKRIRDEYANFLTPDEIESILKGSDIYLDADEIMDRLELYAEARDSQGCGDPNCEGCSQEPEVQETVDDLIAEAVDAGITKAMDKLMKKYSLVEKEVVPKATKPKAAKAKNEGVNISEAPADFKRPDKAPKSPPAK